jgi:hypothetical protein
MNGFERKIFWLGRIVIGFVLDEWIADAVATRLKPLPLESRVTFNQSDAGALTPLT